MRPGMQLLLDLLRGQAKTNDFSETQWMTVLDLAEQENVLPWTAACLRSALLAVPTSQVAARLHQIERNARIAAFLWTSTLKSILAEFHRRGVPVISLKGPWLAERLYGDAALRSCVDLDLLIRPTDIALAEKLLADLRFSPAGRRDDYERPWRRDGLTVELHHNVENPLAFDFGIEHAWDRALVAQYQAVPARLLAPADELLYLCLHGTRHRFERLSHVLDLTFAFRHFPVPQTGARTRPTSELDNILALGWMMATRLDPQITTSNMFRGGESLQVLADQLWRERMSRTAPALDWSAQHQFYLQLETPGWRRLVRRHRHLRILLTRLIDDDFAFAERFSLHRTWQVWLLRPIRLLGRSVQASPTPP